MLAIITLVNVPFLLKGTFTFKTNVQFQCGEQHKNKGNEVVKEHSCMMKSFPSCAGEPIWMSLAKRESFIFTVILSNTKKDFMTVLVMDLMHFWKLKKSNYSYVIVGQWDTILEREWVLWKIPKSFTNLPETLILTYLNFLLSTRDFIIGPVSRN